MKPETANYRPATAGEPLCSDCKWFDANGNCSVLEQPVDPKYTCDVYMPREAEPEETSDNSPSDVAATLMGGYGGNPA